MSPLSTNQTPTTSSPTPSNPEAEWESRMAQLVGLESPAPDESSTNLTPPAEVPETKTKQPISSNPFAKLGVVGTATFIVVIFTGGFLSQIMSNGKQERQIAPIQETPQPPTQPRAQQLEDEVEALKTKLALAEQAQAVKAAQQQLRRVRPAPTPQVVTQPTREPQRDSTPALPRTPTPVVKTVYVPKVVEVERVVRVPQVVEKIVRVPQPVAKNTAQKTTPPPQRTAILPPLPPIPSPAATPPTPILEIEPPPPPSPLEEWSRLAKLGSYGAVTPNQERANNTTASVPVREKQPESVARRTQPEERRTTPAVSQTPRSGKSTVVGSSAKAVLATALFGENARNKSDESDSNNVFVVRLQEPLKTANGDVALPAGSELLTQLSTISENGLVELEINKVVMQKGGKSIQRTIPQNALAIRAPKGKPLIANQFPNKSGSIASMDAGLFVLGGIGKAAELLNRVERRTVFLRNDEGEIEDSLRDYNYPDPNIAAGVLEGGMKSVVPSISRRNQRAISEMMRRTNIWFLPAGKEVEIYVNQEVQF